VIGEPTRDPRRRSRERRKRAGRSILVGAALLLVVGAGASSTDAEIEGGVFSSKSANIRLTLPRGWRWSDQATYPGIVLRMNRTRPRATILLAVDPAPTTIDPSCENRPPQTEGAAAQPYPPEMQAICQQSLALVKLGFTVSPIKEAARPWFDYSTKDHELREGVFLAGGNVYTLVLAAETAAGRANYASTFDKALRGLRLLAQPGEEEATDDGGVPAPISDAGVPDAP
jgi:hypothetical protein